MDTHTEDRARAHVHAPSDAANTAVHTDLDLTVSRIIRAPRELVWSACTDPRKFEKWWVPAPEVCRVVAMELRPGGDFRTELRGDDGYGPHITGCFLALDELERIVFTDTLIAGWRPAENSFLTAVITIMDHPVGTEYTATAMHRNRTDPDEHDRLGFHDGWGTVTPQLAELVE